MWIASVMVGEACMEGPSIFLAKEQLKPFKKKVVLDVSVSTKIDKDRFKGQLVKDIFSWGKHLLFQFDGFALKAHFLLFVLAGAITALYVNTYEVRKPKEKGQPESFGRLAVVRLGDLQGRHRKLGILPRG
jgi:hypothetical protein